MSTPKKDAPAQGSKKEELFVIDFGDKITCTLRRPSRKIVAEALGIMVPMTEGGKPDIIGAGEWILATCWVEGDDRIKDPEGEYVITAAMKAFSLVKLKSAELKKK